jgi:hypothetical protein
MLRGRKPWNFLRKNLHPSPSSDRKEAQKDHPLHPKSRCQLHLLQEIWKKILDALQAKDIEIMDLDPSLVNTLRESRQAGNDFLSINILNDKARHFNPESGDLEEVALSKKRPVENSPPTILIRSHEEVPSIIHSIPPTFSTPPGRMQAILRKHFLRNLLHSAQAGHAGLQIDYIVEECSLCEYHKNYGKLERTSTRISPRLPFTAQDIVLPRPPAPLLRELPLTQPILSRRLEELHYTIVFLSVDSRVQHFLPLPHQSKPQVASSCHIFQKHNLTVIYCSAF